MSTRRNDPGRRDRIIDAALEVIAEDGVVGASARRIAARAGVPLGSVTYHFTGMDELLHEAFTRFSLRISDRFEGRMAGARSLPEVADAVVQIILRDTFGDRDSLVVTLELYTLAARRPEFRRITRSWMARSRASLERHVLPETARQLDGLVEGLSIHHALDPGPYSEALARAAVERLILGAAPTGFDGEGPRPEPATTQPPRLPPPADSDRG
ncbi:TetR/AcrR family transcriptional regulator [Streptomyces spiramenti]|uniref:TetR family transcriptional regulator n=1 Tax=Streptomyces spiramenti TaxID=2720606 RepID=A0ABX1AI27_9ACTN|nr:TetR family transcriptional regulator [Streptomyces spiramenti]NJP65316.1 TetR family transcriptional regulator [Streptomyces spiramenti]